LYKSCFGICFGPGKIRKITQSSSEREASERHKVSEDSAKITQVQIQEELMVDSTMMDLA